MQWSLNQCRQLPIVFFNLNCKTFSSFDLFLEEFAESGNQLLWRTVLDDGAHVVGETYWLESREGPWARKHEIDHEPYHCWTALLWEEPMQYATMPRSAVVPCMEYSGMASAGVNGNCLRCTPTYLVLFVGS